MRRSLIAGATMAAAALVSSVPAAAQGHGRGGAVPPGQRPPAGLCRVWVEGLPPGQQPGVSDCSYARTHVPPGGRVLYGGPAPRRASTVNHAYAPYYYGAKSVDDRVSGRAGKANGKWKHEGRKDAKDESKDEKDHDHGKHHD